LPPAFFWWAGILLQTVNYDVFSHAECPGFADGHSPCSLGEFIFGGPFFLLNVIAAIALLPVYGPLLLGVVGLTWFVFYKLLCQIATPTRLEEP
jgi:hypothetical protein